jgi:UDP-N-acetylglucosamine--N-acetylmuramyl-(pentapeptide) pyrophosphoryl-undecaprenol N-acetylglucosamine transferase
MNTLSRNIVLATGGTGGHIFPAMAVASALLEKNLQPIFYTDTRFAQYTPPEMGQLLADVPVHVVASGRSGGGLNMRLMNLYGVLKGVRQAVALLRQHQPSMVVGFGGYPSLPSMIAAVLLRIPVVLHEQNAYLGRSNRLMVRWARALYTSHKQVQGVSGVAAEKTIYVGNPVRNAVILAGETPYPLRGVSAPFHLLVMGGSQGAQIFGDTVPDAIAALNNDLRALIHVVQQVRPEALDQVQSRYNAMGVAAECAAFFPDIAARMAAAHLVISRAGASSVAECNAAGRPALYVPLPSAMDNHQWHNASAAADAGAAWRVPQDALSPQSLAEMLGRAIANPNDLTMMAARAKALAEPDAANTLAEHIVAACHR